MLLDLPADLPTREVGHPPTQVVILPLRGVSPAARRLMLVAAAAGGWLPAPGRGTRQYRTIGALARRGWVELDRSTHFRRWRLTETGSAALGDLAAG